MKFEPAAMKIQLTVTAAILVVLSTSTTANDLFGDLVPSPVYNLTVGDIKSMKVEHEIGAVFGLSLIPSYLKIPYDATLHTLKFKIGSKHTPDSKLYLQVWRPVGQAQYKLILNIEAVGIKVGLNELSVRWYVTAGDYVGISCSTVCSVMKDISQNYMSQANVHSNTNRQYYPGMILSFTASGMYGGVAVEATMEANKRYATTTVSLPATTYSSTTSGESSGDNHSTKSQGQATTNRAALVNETISEGKLNDWVLIVVIIVVALFMAVAVIAILVVCYVRGRDKQNNGYQRQDNSSVSFASPSSRPDTPVSPVSPGSSIGARHQAPVGHMSEVSTHEQTRRYPQSVTAQTRPNTLKLSQYSDKDLSPPSPGTPVPPPLPPKSNEHEDIIVTFDNGQDNSKFLY